MRGFEPDVPEGVVSGLREGLGEDLVSVVLFGSRARGEAREGSDWDFLVVARDLPEGTLERVFRLKKMLPPLCRGEASLLAKTPEEFVAGLPDLYLDIALDGVVLHDTDGYMAERLELLRALIHRKRLHREREGRDLIWRWEQPPGPDWSLEWGGGHITGREQAAYRLKLAQGFLEEAQQDAGLERWRSAVDGAQLAVENAGKAALELAGQVGRTHNPATQLRRLIEDKRFDAAHREKPERLAELSELLGPDIHVQTDYGDEAEGRTPWELFGEDDARQALAVAEEAVDLADQMVREGSHEQ